MADAKIVAPDFAAIEAAGLPAMGEHWCAWKLVPRDGGKASKVPYGRSGAISSQKPDTWVSYEDAKALHECGGFSGVGYLNAPSDGIVCLDADGVLDSDGTVVGSAVEIVTQLEALGCYLELSPSGRGLRGFLKGSKGGGSKARTSIGGHSVEVYQTATGAEAGQYVTVTGAPFGEVRPVDAGPEGQWRLVRFLDWAGLTKNPTGDGAPAPKTTVEWKRRDDEAAIQLVLGRLNLQGKINQVWAGDISAYGGQSEARAALLNQVCYVTRDPDQIDRIMRQSALDVRKMDEKRSGGTFLRYEIERALERQKRSYDADGAEKRAGQEQAKASASALKVKAAEVMAPGLGIDDLRDGRGRLNCSVRTASELLIRDGRLAGVLYFDEFAGTERKAVSLRQAFADRCAPDSTGELRDADLTAVTVWLEAQWGLDVSANDVGRVSDRWARATPINPVIDRLTNLAAEWDKVPRLDSWLSDFLGASAPDEDMRMYLSEVGKRFLIGVVARAFKPGVQQHQMMVLEGVQGDGKSAAVRTLAQAVGEDIYLEGFTLSDDKDCLLRLRGKLIGEWSELAGFGKRESETIKEFITRSVDEYRDPYGRRVQKQPRTVSFFATTNEGEYLRDATGNRRYWPVKVGQIDIASLREVAGQLFGEAVMAYLAGARWWIDQASSADARFRAICDREQRGRMVATAFDDLALDLADRLVNGALLKGALPAPPFTSFSVPEMQAFMFPGAGSVSSGEWLAAVGALKRVGWLNDRTINGRRNWYLSEWKAAELRKMHNLSEPDAKGRKKPRKVGAGRGVLSLVAASGGA